ncbi:hypothetical protein BGX26_007652, partial [Mortierella sp. AD094]
MSSTQLPTSFSAPSALFIYSLPPEVTLMVAEYFTRSTLRVALQVCRDWKNTLGRLIWSEILEMDWHHSSFPTQPLSNTHLRGLAPNFVHTNKFAWHSNKALSQRRATIVPLVLSAQLPSAAVTKVLSMMPNLWSVELHVDICPTVSCLENLMKLKKLKQFELNMLSCETAGFSVAKFAELFSRITSLRLIMPAETNEISMVNLPVTSPWIMSVMEIEPEAIPLVAQCKQLKELTVSCDRDFEPVAMRPVLACERLEILRANVHIGSLSDHAEVLVSLLSLRHLEVVVASPTEIGFLQAEESAIDLPLPSLEAIVIRHTHLSDRASSSGFCNIYSSLLRTRPNLIKFSVEGDNINPLLIFSEPEQDEDSTEWTCHNLEDLSLTLSWPASSINTSEKMRRQWVTVFNQIDKLSHLKYLSIESEDLEEYPGLGFLENCHCLPEL